MFGSSKQSFPRTSETCKLLLEGIKLSIDSTDPFRQSDAKRKLEMLRDNKCKKALIWISNNYRSHPSPFVQQLAKKALEYAESL
jgi:hypothetical protein